jgi:hypothetical protein
MTLQLERMRVNILLSVALSTLTIFVILLLVFQMFRVPVESKVSKVIMASVIVGIYNNVLTEGFHWTTIEPILSVLLMTLFVKLIARMNWMIAFMATIIGTASYTVILAFAILLMKQLSGESMEAIFFERSYEVESKIVTYLVVCLLIYLMKYYRIGFTTLNYHKLKPRTGTGISVLSIAFAVIVITIVIGIAVIEMKLSNFIWVVLSFCFSLLILFYSFYRKEMEDS